MSLCKLPVGTCGAHFVLRDLMAPTLMFGSHPSPWKAIRTRRHHPQAFTGRPAEALVGPYEQQLSTRNCCRTLNLSLLWDSFFFFLERDGNFSWKTHIRLLQGWPLPRFCLHHVPAKLCVQFPHVSWSVRCGQ
ncbi:polymerase (DNA-directed), delta interacting protein 2 (predicted) [Rattus norvegicus]|uniref:Polymerase (DNA-directed), delta interacting protein 2 (Predicted) n=1 Tax=Rattus norvegicus TaxID=10116 RepID=A6HH57_RAT|nr:polymerase (DNA-directed), delta interacting protein 2 (predicted) [Rattus norvegicus]|eukprot:NP_001099286.1 polymerase delta-interacting protein 2 [Rattus norvegicus]